MADSRINPLVEAYLNSASKWQEEMEKLREIALDCGLAEELKWDKPCYTFQGKNIVIIQGFKAFCALLFFKGVLLNDPKDILVKTGKNTRIGRQARFTDVKEIIKNEATLKAYIQEAIEVEKAGLKVNLEKISESSIPKEFQNKLNEIPALKVAFEALAPIRQKEYLLYFSEPKQSKMRDARIEKWIPHILSGKAARH